MRSGSTSLLHVWSKSAKPFIRPGSLNCPIVPMNVYYAAEKFWSYGNLGNKKWRNSSANLKFICAIRQLRLPWAYAILRRRFGDSALHHAVECNKRNAVADSAAKLCYIPLAESVGYNLSLAPICDRIIFFGRRFLIGRYSLQCIERTLCYHVCVKSVRFEINIL